MQSVKAPSSKIRPQCLTHCRLETPKRIIGKQYRPRSDAAEQASDQGLHCLQIV